MLFVEDEYFPAQSATVRAAGPALAAQLGCRAGYTPPPLLQLCSPPSSPPPPLPSVDRQTLQFVATAPK